MRRDALGRMQAELGRARQEVEDAYTAAVRREEELYFDLLKGDDEWSSLSGYYQGAEDDVSNGPTDPFRAGPQRNNKRGA